MQSVMVFHDVKKSDTLQNIEIDSVDTDSPKPAVHHTPVIRAEKRRIWPLILIILLIIGGGLTAYWYLREQTSGTVQPSTGSSSATDSPKLTAEALVAKAKTVTKGEIKTTLQNTDNLPYNVFNAPVYQPKGYNFSVSPTIDYGFGSYGTKDIMANDLTTIEQVLVDNKLSETVLDPGSDTASFAALYESADIICLVTDQKPYNEPASSANYTTILGCANTADYISNAAALRSYFIVYSSQGHINSADLALGTPNVKQSKNAGYTIATVSISSAKYGEVGGFAGLFYSTPDGALHYFVGTQSEITCDKFNTVDLKKAYAGEQCYDTATDNSEAIVK